MSIEFFLKIIGCGVVFWLFYKWGEPKAKTKELAIILWSSFGPYSSADHAERYLRLAYEVVLGKEGVSQHEEVLKAHSDNFKTWEREGVLEKKLNMMIWSVKLGARGSAFKEAYQKLYDVNFSLLTDSIESLNKDYLEGSGSKIEAEKQEDGTTSFLYKQIWSDEKIKQKSEETSKAVLNAVGKRLLEDRSKEALLLLEFLKKVWAENADGEIETEEEIGKAWISCSMVSEDLPDSELAQNFTLLNDAWNPPKLEEDG